MNYTVARPLSHLQDYSFNMVIMCIFTQLCSIDRLMIYSFSVVVNSMFGEHTTSLVNWAGCWV